MISMIDGIIIVLYLGIMIVIGYFSGKNNENQQDYFLARRSMPFIPIALSVAATMISANGFIGGPGWAYNEGMYPFMVNISVPIAVLVALSITTPVIYHLKITSVYEYMGMRLGKYSRVLTITQFFVNSIIQVSSMVFIPVLILELMTGWSFYVLVPFVVITAIIYTLLGGIRAVIWTDSIQMVVVIGAVILVIIVALNGIGLGFFDTLAVAKEAGKLDTLDFRTDLTITNTFWATVFGGAAMWIRYFCFDQAQVQRVLTAKSLDGARKSFVVSAFIMNIVYYVMLLVGAVLFVYYDGVAFGSSNEIMILFVVNEMPVGIIGLIIAGVFAAAMSSVDSLLNSMTAVFTKDIYEPIFNKKKEASLKVSMVISIVIGIIMIIVVYIGFNGSVKSILDLVGAYISYFSGPALGAFVLAMFTRRANDKGVALGFVAGMIIGYIIATTYSISWLWNPLIGATLTIVIGYLLSMMCKNTNTSEMEALTAWEVRKKLKTTGEKHLPFSFGKVEIIVIVFFLLQFVFLAIVQYS